MSGIQVKSKELQAGIYYIIFIINNELLTITKINLVPFINNL